MSKWLLNPLDDSKSAQLFCFPYAGSGASLYRSWPTEIHGIGINPVQLPGRENRLGEEHNGSFSDWAADFTDAIQDSSSPRRRVLFGHCMGAITAAAVAAEMNQRGIPPRALIVSSSRVPYLPPEQRYLPPAPGAVGVYHMSMSERDLGDELKKVLKSQGIEVPQELLPIALGVLTRDLQRCFTYRPEKVAPVGCPVHAVAWDKDVDVAPEEMEMWKSYGTSYKKHVLPGDKMSFANKRDDLFRLFYEIALGEIST